MAAERRNLYRILHVQPEAPPEVIKAAYRALMTTLRAHPDLGGDHEQAARLNVAYEVLADPERRRAYDRSMRQPVRGVAGSDPVTCSFDPWCWQADRRCPFCGHGFGGMPAPYARCARCDSPLAAAPATGRSGREILGRRRGQRFARDMPARVRAHGQKSEWPARRRDLSQTGLSLHSAHRIANGIPARVMTASFDAVAVIVASRRGSSAFIVHARLLTLLILSAARGVYVSAVA
jgi:curved DNA-binding protein CbpA